MGEKNEVKVRLSTVIYILIILVLVVALGVVYYLGFVKDDNSNNMIANGEVAEKNNISVNEQLPETNNNVEENVEESKEVGKIDKDKELIYTDYNKISSEYYFSIPKINVNSQEVVSINNEIEKVITEVKGDVQEGVRGEYARIDYTSYINGEVLSVVISKYGDSDYTDYMVYNINLKTGKTYKNAELLNLKGMNESQFLSKLPELYKEKYMGDTVTEDQLNNSFHSEAYNKTVAKENYSINEPMFLDDNGNINVVAKIYRPAGGLPPHSEIIIVK